MRLICPKCDAQYDLEPGLIPPEGHEVECSACAHVWYQRARPPLRTPAPVRPGKAPAPAASPAPAAAPLGIGPFEDDEDDAPLPPPPRRPLNESLLAVLREEAEREARARQTEAARFEIQEQLALDEPPKARRKPAPPSGATAEPAVIHPFTAPHAGTLPDPEALAASVMAAPQPVESDLGPETSPVPATKGRPRFTLGFMLALIALALATLLYMGAPQIAQRWPAAEPVLRGYSEAVGTLRTGLAELWVLLRGKLGL